MSRYTHSLIGGVILCMWFGLTCSLYAEDLPRPLTTTNQSGQRFITIDFDNVDIQLFIKYISELTGKNFVVDRAVQGNVTILSPTKISEEDAYRVFESVLDVHGFTTVDAGSVIKILPSARARSQNLPILSAGSSKNPQDKVVTQLVFLKHSSPDDIKKGAGTACLANVRPYFPCAIGHADNYRVYVQYSKVAGHNQGA